MTVAADGQTVLVPVAVGGAATPTGAQIGVVGGALAGAGGQRLQMSVGGPGPGDAAAEVDSNIEPTFGENFGSKIKSKLNQLRKKYPTVREAKKGGIDDALAIAKNRVAQGGGRVGPPVGQGEICAIYFEDGPVTWVFRPNGQFWSMRKNPGWTEQ
jgi:hypothetical protein